MMHAVRLFVCVLCVAHQPTRVACICLLTIVLCSGGRSGTSHSDDSADD